MKQNRFWLISAFVMLALFLVACGGGSTPAPAEEPEAEEPAAEVEEEAMEEEAAEEEEAMEEEAMEEEAAADGDCSSDDVFCVGLVTDVGQVDDKSFNQSAWEGALLAESELGAQVQYIETGDATDYAENISLFVDGGYDVIVTVGFALGEATAIAASENPDISFIGVDQFQGAEVANLAGLIFPEAKAGYLAGALAAMMSESGTIGAVLGTDLVPPVVNFKEGYEAGAQAINADINLISTYHPGGLDVAFTDPEWGATTAAQAIDQGADVIFGAGGNTGNGALIEIAGNEGVYCIGVDTDQWGTLPQAHPCLISSAMKLITPGVLDLVSAAQSGEMTGGNFVGEVGLAPFHDFEEMIPDYVKATLEMIDAGLADGSIDPLSTDPIEVMGDDAMMEDEAMAGGECTVDLTGEEIVIYQQAGREGPLAALLGQGFAYATEDAVDYMNSNGGICGATVRVEFGETNYDVEQEVAVYEQFRVSDPKPSVLMTYGSGATVALKDRVVEDQIVNFAAGLNAEAMYNPADGYTLGLAPIYSDQFAGWVQYLSENWDTMKPEGASDDIVVGVIGWPNAFGAGATTPEAIAHIESLGVTVLPLEEAALSPDADLSGPMQNLLLGGANVIWNQSLSFTVAQVVGTTHGLGAWDSVVMSGVNWSMHDDVPNFLGENPQLMNGYCGPFPYAYWSDTDVEGVQLAIDAFAEAGRPEADRTTTYLTTFGQFLALRTVMIEAANQVGSADISGADVLNTMIGMGDISGGDISVYEIDDVKRAPQVSNFRCIEWDGEQLNWNMLEEGYQLPDTAPYPEG